MFWLQIVKNADIIFLYSYYDAVIMVSHCKCLIYLLKIYKSTVKPLNFARDLISLILQVMKIREIKTRESSNFTLKVTVERPGLQIKYLQKWQFSSICEIKFPQN